MLLFDPQKVKDEADIVTIRYSKIFTRNIDPSCFVSYILGDN